MANENKIQMSKEEAEELKKMMTQYPKMALAGKQVVLDMEWKKVFVALRALAIINIDLTNKASKLSSQLSDSFNESLEKETTIEDTVDNRKELQICFRIKNLLRASKIIQDQMNGINGIIDANAVQKEIYLVYVSTKHSLDSIIDENQKVANDTDTTLVKCFNQAQGINLEEIERQTVGNLTTRKDIESLVKQMYFALNLKVGENN